MLKLTTRFAIIILLSATFLFAQEPVDLQMVQKIKNEGVNNSKVMETISYLTDVYGPRLTGSPQLRVAAEWTVDRLKSWGIEKAEIEDWGTFGRGWTMEKVTAEMTAPQYTPLIAYPKAWTKSTNGTLSGNAVLLDIEDESELEAFKDSLAGAIVLLGKPMDWEPKFEPDAERYDEEDLMELEAAPIPGEKSPWAARAKERRAHRELNKKITAFLENENIGVILEASEREHGTARVYRGGSYDLDKEPGLPNLVVSNEQYGRLYRIAKKNIPVNLNINIQNKFYEEDTVAFNVIAEIPGTDKKLKKEVVLLGGHLDSWHTGTGATDNAAASAVMMEALRILKALGIQPKRTIRLGLWSGEEQGYLGSRGYLAKHYGESLTMELKPEHKDFSVYFNLDNGAGKIRGIYLQGNDAARPIFEAWFKPFNDMGAETVTIQNTSGTDHIPFNQLGLPGFQFIQDPIDYMNRTHHTNMDVYEHVIAGDVIQSAIIVATFAYHAAMREGQFPRQPLPEPRKKSSWE